MSETVWSRKGRACPFARARKEWEPSPYASYAYVRFPSSADSGRCGDWCQLFDDDVQDCKLTAMKEVSE
uniref:Uncharacterized protein n=1 Tax=viral metagenome TaxID=1070528 RepID=A0A6M3KMX6_9ZZZZ